MIKDLVWGVLVATCSSPEIKFLRLLAEGIVHFKSIKPMVEDF